MCRWIDPCVSRKAVCRMKCSAWLFGTSRWLAHRLSTSARRGLPHVVRYLRQNPHGHNTLGSVVVSSALAFLYFQTQPITAGTDPAPADSAELVADAEKMFSDEATSGTGSDTNDSEKNSATSVAANDTPTLTGKEALRESDRLLAEAQARLEKIPAYSATFVKQERVGDSLTEMQVIQLRLFHQPLKVFMKWEGGPDAGQRVLYSAGDNDGDMLVRKLKGFEARLGVISLNPCGAIALKYSRYPVTSVGLLQLTKIIREQRAKDRSEERRVGKECTSWCRSRWSPYH